MRLRHDVFPVESEIMLTPFAEKQASLSTLVVCIMVHTEPGTLPGEGYLYIVGTVLFPLQGRLHKGCANARRLGSIHLISKYTQGSGKSDHERAMMR